MIQKIRNIIMTLSLVGMAAAPVAISTSAAALISPSDVQNNLCSGTNGDLSGGTTSCNNGDTSSLNTIIKNIVNILSVIVGVAAVIMIIIGGFRYITSGGESGNVSGAKNTLIYAIVGLVIVALAQFIVHFVLNQTSNITSTS